MRNPAFSALLSRMAALHESKNADYAADGDPLSNFRQAGAVAEGFTGADAVFASLIGVKLARLRELTASGKAPNHESVADTRIDLAMYATLWASYHEPTPAHDERHGLAEPCTAGCGVRTYPPGRCVGCRRASASSRAAGPRPRTGRAASR